MNFIHHHHIMITLVCAYVFSAGIQTMPTPKKDSPTSYTWLFNFLHVISANLERIPQVRAFMGQYVVDIDAPKKKEDK